MASGRRFIFAALLSKIVSAVHADFTPTAPGPGQTFTAGGNCTIMWDVDESGTWNNVTIDLMSGSNTNMTLVTNVISELDGTNSSLTPYNWTCPEVDPYSAIYFYQFTNNGQSSDAKWTTRFTISSSSNETVPPPNATQPNGDPIPWGVGHLTTNSESASTNSSVVNTTVACDPANIAHFEQINIQDLHAKPSEDEDDEDDGDSHNGDDEDEDDDRHGSDARKPDDHDDDDEDSEDDHDNSDGSRGHSKHASDTNESDKDHDGSKDHKGEDSDDDEDGKHEKANAHSSSHSKSEEPEELQSTRSTTREIKTLSKSRPSASGKASIAAASAMPTAALPPSIKAHSSSSASGVKAESEPTASTTFVASPSGTCQCISDKQGNLKLVGGDKRMVEMSPWVYVSPLLLVWLVVC